MTPGLCHCGLHLATVPATVAGVRIDLCPGCVAHYRSQRWPDGSSIEVRTWPVTPSVREWTGRTGG